MKSILTLDTPDTFEFDSDEERYFFWWCRELMKAGFIDKLVYEPQSFDLSKPIWKDYQKEMVRSTKWVEEELLKGHIYTTDFLIEWNPEKKDIIWTWLYSDIRKKQRQSLQYLLANESEGNFFSYVEVKPSFDQNNMTRLAKINQKWVWEKHGIYVDICIPDKLFKNTFTPQRYLFRNKSGKPRKIKWDVTTLKQFLNPNKSQIHF